MRLGWRKRVDAQNKLLGEELGRTYQGYPRYKWVWSEDQEFYRSKLVVYKDAAGKLDPAYKVREPNCTRTQQMIPNATTRELVPNPHYDPEAPVLARVEPEYTREKLLPKIVNCFVMCRWMDNGGFEEFKARFGDKLEWPGEGSYFPVEHSRGVVQLYPNQEPTKDDTWEFIRILRKDTQLGTEAIMEQIEKGEKDAEKRAFLKNMGRIDNVLPAYDHIPGKRGSGGIWARGGDKEFQDMAKQYEIGGGAFYTAGEPGDTITRELRDQPFKPPRTSQIMDQPQAGQ